MTCREFQSRWDALLDADARVAAMGADTTPDRATTSAEPAIDDVEEALHAHAASCPECRQIAAQWQVLRHAIRAWRQPPVPSASLVDRILAADASPQSLQWGPVTAVERSRSPRRAVLLACTGVAAAILIALILPGLRMLSSPSPDGRPANPPIVAFQTQDLHAASDPALVPDHRHALNQALAEATSATWDLARSASEPAARISRDVLDATTHPEGAATERTSDQPRAAGGHTDSATTGLTVSVLSWDQLAPDAPSASTVLQQVGDHLSAGVRPLSDTARHAFGFLIGPARDQPAPRVGPPSAKGA